MMELTTSRKLVISLLAPLVVVPVLFFGGRAIAVATCFSDVDDSKWYEPFVCAMADRGILNGYPDGTFRPENTITRAETATIASRILDETIDHGEIVLGHDGHEWTGWGTGLPSTIVRWISYTNASGDGTMAMGLTGPVTLDGQDYALKSVEICALYVSGGSITQTAVWITGDGPSPVLETFDSTVRSTDGCYTMDVGVAAPHGAGVGVLVSGGASAIVRLHGVQSTWAPVEDVIPPAGAFDNANQEP